MYQRTLRVGVSCEARAQSTAFAHRFRNPLYHLHALRIGIPKRKFVHSHLAAKAREAVDEEWAAHSCGSHQSDFHDSVISFLAIFRSGFPLPAAIRLSCFSISFQRSLFIDFLRLFTVGITEDPPAPVVASAPQIFPARRQSSSGHPAR